MKFFHQTREIEKGDKVSNIFLKRDLLTSASAFEIDDNDLKSWAMYIRIDNSVIRINYLNLESGIIKFDTLTPDFNIPKESNMNSILGGIIEKENFKKHNLTTTDYKTIRREF